MNAAASSSCVIPTPTCAAVSSRSGSRRGGDARGLGTAALALAGRWLLTDGGLERVSLLATPDHAALRGAARDAGYRAEGILRGYRLGPAGRVDAEVHSLVIADVSRPD